MDLHIAFSSDNNYVAHLGVAIISLLENNRKLNIINIHVLDNNISFENKERLKEIVSNKASIYFYELSELLGKLDKQYNIPKTISISAYARLFLSDILDENISKILYVDCDALFMDSLEKLWSIDISQNSVAGVLDHVGIQNKLKIGLKKDDYYINSGFLLINLEKWRKTNALKQMLYFIESKNGNVIHHDQGVINACFEDDILILPPHYNVMTSFFDFRDVESIKHYYGITNYYSQNDINEAKKNPVFVHFTPSFSKRPWVVGCKHPLKGIYKEYLLKTPFKNNGLQKDDRSFKIRFLEKIFWVFGAKFYKSLFK
jgi:lipopolysaccharide biosynthesis glycosyltransferase